MINEALEERLFGPGKKKCLTLDGGGTRGVITLQFLKQMEKVLREETGRKDMVLSDFFDLAAGTSVGSMLATMVAMGKPTEEIDEKFTELAKKIFSEKKSLFGMNHYNASHLVNSVRSIVRGETLASDELKIGLVIIAKRTDTGSVWVLSNNRKMPYWEDSGGSQGNKHYKLESVIRASTAAPVFFSAASMKIHSDDGDDARVQIGDFVDGGVSPHNNPSMQVLLMAGLDAYNLGWKLTPEDLLMISVGTGIHRNKVDRSKRLPLPGFLSAMLPGNVKKDMRELLLAAESLRCVISDNSLYALKLMQAISHPRFSWIINSEINDFNGHTLLTRSGLTSAIEGRSPSLLTFQRYDLPLDKQRYLKKELADEGYYGFAPDFPEQELLDLQPIDNPVNLTRLAELAGAAAEKQVSAEDFRPFL